MALFNVTIDNTKVDATLTDYPLYVDLSDMPANFWSTVAAGGGDIRVYEADGITELAREVVYCDTATDTGELHIKVPSVSGTVDTVVKIDVDGIRSDYGVAATYGRNAVWSNGFQAVFHLQEDPTTSAPQFADSTGNGRNLTAQGSMTSGDSVAGKLSGKGIDFDGINDALRNTAWTWGGGAVTLTGWNKSRTPNQGSDWVGFNASSTLNRFSNHGPWSDGNWYWDYGNALGAGRISTSYTSYNNAWTHVALVSSGSANTFRGIYFNGALVNSIAGSSSPASNPTNFAIGSGDVGRFNKGEIDEVRIAEGVRAATWISTEYNNQNSTSTFYVVTTESSSGQIKVYDGTAFVAKPVKVWNGSAWVIKPLKRWDGTVWVTTPY